MMSRPVPFAAEVREAHTVSVACVGGHFGEDAFIEALDPLQPRLETAKPGDLLDAPLELHTWTPLAAWLVGGALAAAGLTKYIQTLLFGVGRLDLIAFAGMSAVMLAVAMLASYIPARRASRVDPVVALRAE